MRVSDTKKKAGSVAVTSILLLGVGVGYAFWTADGTSTGKAETGTTAEVTAVQTSVVDGLGPGVPARQLAGTFTNAGTTTVRVFSLAASITKVTRNGVEVVGCDATDYHLSKFPLTVTQDVAPGENQGLWAGGTIEFNNKADQNQDACKGATVEITYTVS